MRWGIAGVPSFVLLPCPCLSLPSLTLGSPGPPPWAHPLLEEPLLPLAECADGEEVSSVLGLCCRKNTHRSHWYLAYLSRGRAGPCSNTTPLLQRALSQPAHVSYLCLSPIQGFISLQGTQVTELLPDPEDPGKHLFEITPGRPRVSMSAEVVLVAPESYFLQEG